MANPINLSYFLGETWELSCSFVGVNNQPLDLTGGTVDMYVYPIVPMTASALLHLSSANGDFIAVNAAAGEFQIAIANTQQSVFSPGFFRYKIFTDSASGESDVQLAGHLEVKR
jgi:hypothetical protein